MVQSIHRARGKPAGSPLQLCQMRQEQAEPLPVIQAPTDLAGLQLVAYLAEEIGVGLQIRFEFLPMIGLLGAADRRLTPADHGFAWRHETHRWRRVHEQRRAVLGQLRCGL